MTTKRRPASVPNIPAVAKTTEDAQRILAAFRKAFPTERYCPVELAQAAEEEVQRDPHQHD